MGLQPLPDVKDYFSTKWVDKMPFSDIFPRNRFLLILLNVYFSLEEGPDCDFKIRNKVSHMKEKCPFLCPQ